MVAVVVAVVIILAVIMVVITIAARVVHMPFTFRSTPLGSTLSLVLSRNNSDGCTITILLPPCGWLFVLLPLFLFPLSCSLVLIATAAIAVSPTYRLIYFSYARTLLLSCINH